MHTELEQDRIYVAVDLMLLSVSAGRLHLLLSRRVHPPFNGLWAMPGCLVALDESADAAAHRLLEEMLPLPDIYLEQLYTFTGLNRDPRGRVISVAYLAILPAGSEERITREGETGLRGFIVDTQSRQLRLKDAEGRPLLPGDLAFDHGKIIRMGISRLQGKIDYTDIGFYFLEDRHHFALGELQTVYEVILGRPLDASNFRRSLLARYEKTERIVKTSLTDRPGRGRPSVMYSMKDRKESEG